VFLIEEPVLSNEQFYDQGFSILIPVLIYSFIQTAFAEEFF